MTRSFTRARIVVAILIAFFSLFGQLGWAAQVDDHPIIAQLYS